MNINDCNTKPLDVSQTVSVIVPTYNRADMVCACIRSVLATEYPALEVIVVDDCSPDDTGIKIIAEFGKDKRVRYLRNEKNASSTVSRNNGARCATGAYLMFLDDDNIVHKDIFTELIRAFRCNDSAGLVAPLAIHMRPGKEHVVWTLGSDFNRWTSQPNDRGANIPVADLIRLKANENTTVLSTTYSPNAFMVPRYVYDMLNGFDESYEQMFEESDFGWRVLESGLKCYIATDAVTEHFGFVEPGCSQQLRQLGIEKPYRTYCFARNRIRFARKYFTFIQALSVAFVFAPLSAVYYSTVAIKNGRFDIAWAYIKGTFAGIVGNYKQRD